MASTSAGSAALGKLRRKLVSRALLEPEFQDALIEAVAEIRAGAKSAPNEATIEGLFERVVYALLKAVGIQFSPEKESAVATKRHVGKGRADSRVGAVIIEYKHRSAIRSDAARAEAIEQLTNYIESISEGTTGDVRGILTDGEIYCEVTARAGEVVLYGGIEQLTPETLFRFIRAVHSLQLTALTPKNLIRDFATPDYQGGIFVAARALDSQLSSGRESDKTRMLRAEWEGLFKLAHEDQSQQLRIQQRRQVLSEIFDSTITSPSSEYQALFCLHTAYAITLKLIAFRVVSDLHFGERQYNFKTYLDADSSSLRTFCEQLEDGEVFRQLGFLNLLEGDFFSWYAGRRQWSAEIASVVRGILAILSRYEDVESVFATTDALDLFRELYESAVPQVVRASFGEFHTPYWLATKVLESAQPTGRWTALDPCCGSGTFVIAAISRIRRELEHQPKEVRFREILERVAGFDLNPLSVLATRVSFFIHIADLLPLNPGEVMIPIYLGDASYVPENVEIDEVKCLTYSIRTLRGDIRISLPKSVASNAASFVKVMYEVEGDVRALDATAAERKLIAATPSHERTTGVQEAIRQLSERLTELERNGWNGIWARILSNFLATACLPKFGCVIGNPPWIDWKNLPAGYRERIKGLCIDRGLFSGAGRTGGINLNICALITNVTILNWLASDGRLAFLMPKELTSQGSYEGWRTTGPGPGRAITALEDWSNAGHPFDPVKEDFMTYVIGPARGGGRTIPVTVYTKVEGVRSPARSWHDWEEASQHLEVSQSHAGAIIPGQTTLTFAASRSELQELSLVAGECSYIGREGIEFYPQELLLFRYIGPGRRSGLVEVENVQVAKSKHPVPLRRRNLEAEFLFPLVKGPNIQPFGLAEDLLIVPFPYDATDPKRPIDESNLRRRAPVLYEYYRLHEEVIRAQTAFSDKIRGEDAGAYYGLARTGPYSFQDVYVGFRDNTKWCACVVQPIDMPWGERKRMLFQNHAVSMCEAAGGRRGITLDEAHFVCAILNAPVVQRFIFSSSDSRSFKIRPPVYIPEYDPRNVDHRALATLSKQAHKSLNEAVDLGSRLDESYLRICRANRRT